MQGQSPADSRETASKRVSRQRRSLESATVMLYGIVLSELLFGFKIHLVSTLPRPHAAVRFLSLRGERNQRRAGAVAPRPQWLFCLSLAAHFFLSAWPACALRVTKRRPLYRNTRNLTIAKVPPHFWGYGSPEADGQYLPRWLRRLCRVRSATGGLPPRGSWRAAERRD